MTKKEIVKQISERAGLTQLRTKDIVQWTFDAIIETLTQETPVKDAATYRRIKYSWVDPNGVVSRATLESDAQLFLDLGLLATPVDLSTVFVDKYREFAVRYLGEYQPPR